MPTINQSMMNTHNIYRDNSGNIIIGNPIDTIVIHYTAGVSSKSGQAANTLAYFNTINNASATFAVDDVNVMQYTDYKKGYRDMHAGNKAMNLRSIGIEICSSNSTGKMTTPMDSAYYFTDAAVDNAVWLVQTLLKEFPNASIIRHYDVTGKECPGIRGWIKKGSISTDETWQAFLKRCREPLESETAEPAEEPVRQLYRVRETWGTDYKTQIGAYTILDNAISACDRNPGTRVFDWEGMEVYPRSSCEYLTLINTLDLNVRNEPNPNSKINTVVHRGTYYTIVAEAMYQDRLWGKLKSGRGWINLAYTIPRK